MRVKLLQFSEHIMKNRAHKAALASVLKIDRSKRNRRMRVKVDRNMLPIYDMADGRHIYRRDGGYRHSCSRYTDGQ